LAPDDLADPVDVALDDVAVEPAVGPHAALEVHGVAGGEATEGGRGEGGGDDVGAPVLAVDRGDGQAAAADGDRVAERDALQDVRGADPQPRCADWVSRVILGGFGRVVILVPA